MTELPESIRTAIDLARNYQLVEEDEVFIEEDGRMMFERVLREFAESGGCLQDILPLIPAFSTTCWKEPRVGAIDGRISWPWAIEAAK